MLAAKHASPGADEKASRSSSAPSNDDLSNNADPLESSTRAVDPSREDGPKPGDIIDGRYVLIEPLGKGGMGVVWKARSTALDVEVAVKLVRSAAASAEAFKRMAREAHAAARLGHPAIATVLDFGATSEGDPYVAMELLRGESLGDVLGREGRMDARRAVGTLLPLIDGLREAHDKGIVHRDIKPENLFVSKSERGRLRPKVLDFGIAKLEQPTDSATKLTQDGAVLGSPGYFSPEQARGQIDIDYRSDIWSISVVLYELVTGELPFSGPNYNALLMSILKDAPISLMDHGFGDEALWHIVEKGLHRDRDQRWASMSELGRALARWLHDQGVRADVASRSLEELWLEAHTGDVQTAAAPPSIGQTERREASTQVKLRVDDTLAQKTTATQVLRAGLSRKVLAWGSAGLALAALGGAWTLGASGQRPEVSAERRSLNRSGSGSNPPNVDGEGPTPPAKTAERAAPRPAPADVDRHPTDSLSAPHETRDGPSAAPDPRSIVPPAARSSAEARTSRPATRSTSRPKSRPPASRARPKRRSTPVDDEFGF